MDGWRARGLAEFSAEFDVRSFHCQQAHCGERTMFLPSPVIAAALSPQCLFVALSPAGGAEFCRW